MAIYKYDGQQWIDYNQYDTALEIVQKSKNNILYLESLHDSGATEEELNRIRNQIIEIQSELSSLEMRTEGIEETLPQKQDALSAGLAIGLYGTTIAVKLQDIAAKLDSVPSGAAITESSADFIRVNNIMYYKTQTIVGGMTTYAYEELTNSDLTERIVAQIPTDFKIDESGRLVLVHDSNVIGMGVEIGGVGVTINAPATATQGTLTATQLGILEASETNYIMFNHEKYYLMDKQHTSGSLTYSHVGADNQVNHIKTFTITLSNLTWVLIDTEIGKSEPPITIVDELPEANEENFERGRIYTQGDLLKYIAKVKLENPTLEIIGQLDIATDAIATASVGTNIYLFGGQYGSTYSNKIFKFSTTSKALNLLNATLPSGGTFGVAAVGTNIYLFGGRVGSTKIYKFDTITESITEINTKMPVAISNCIASAVGENIYIFGGFISGSRTNKIFKFNASAESVIELTTRIPSVLSGAAIAAVETNIYLFGGYTTDWSDKIFIFDTITESISTSSTILTRQDYEPSAAAIGADIYLFGGRGSSVYNQIQKFNTIEKSISILSNTLDKTLFAIGASAVETNIYLFGGSITSSSMDNNIRQFSLDFLFQYKTITAE